MILRAPSSSCRATSLPQDETPPEEKIARLLGARTPDVPFLFPRSDESPHQMATRRILTAEATRLCICTPPDTPETAWLAVRLQGGNLALLASLPRFSPTEPLP